MAKKTYISIGKPIQAPALIPVRHKSSPACINEPFMVDGKVCNVTCLSFGTPHGVVLVDDLETASIEHMGASLETHARFPRGASIVFIQALNKKQIKARLWRRGESESDFTPEAVGVAMTAAKILQKIEHEADVFMGGKKFRVKWNSTDGDVYLAESSGF